MSASKVVDDSGQAARGVPVGGAERAGMTGRSLVDRWSNAMMPTYGAPDIALVRGQGSWVWDEHGARYLDMVAGIATSSLGHAHPAVLDAVAHQMSLVAHTSNLYANEPSVRLAERLVDLLHQGDEGRVFFCNSGAEANEAAFKVARRTGRPAIVTAVGSFHGRTMGALALTGQVAKQAGFGPFPGEVVHVPFGDAEALAAAVDERTAAVFLEPVQGEGGVFPAASAYLRAARTITTQAGALLVLDEVQTGIGRTGTWFGHEAAGIRPDVVTLAKGLGAGLPIGACIGFGRATALLQPGQHGSTFGGNPVACAAGLAVLGAIEDEGLLRHVADVGDGIVRAVESWRHPMVREIRGRGLLLAIELVQPVAAVVRERAMEAGVLLNVVAPAVLRLTPALNVHAEDVDRFLSLLPSLLEGLEGLEGLDGRAGSVALAGRAPAMTMGGRS